MRIARSGQKKVGNAEQSNWLKLYSYAMKAPKIAAFIVIFLFLLVAAGGLENSQARPDLFYKNKGKNVYTPPTPLKRQTVEFKERPGKVKSSKLCSAQNDGYFSDAQIVTIHEHGRLYRVTGEVNNGFKTEVLDPGKKRLLGIHTKLNSKGKRRLKSGREVHASVRIVSRSASYPEIVDKFQFKWVFRPRHR